MECDTTKFIFFKPVARAERFLYGYYWDPTPTFPGATIEPTKVWYIVLLPLIAYIIGAW